MFQPDVDPDWSDLSDPGSPPPLKRQSAIAAPPYIPDAPHKLLPLQRTPEQKQRSEIDAAIERALAYMLKRHSTGMITSPEEQVKIKIERDAYHSKLTRKRKYISAKAKLVFSAPKVKPSKKHRQ
jgi:hypothetical protein